VLTWVTNEPTMGIIYMGETPHTMSPVLTEDRYLSSHQVLVDGLGSCTRYYYKIVAADAWNNTAETPTHSFVSWDRTPPEIKILCPTKNETVWDTTAIRVGVGDTTGITEVTVFLDRKPLFSRTFDTNKAHTPGEKGVDWESVSVDVTVDLSGFVDGTHTLSATCTDVFMNTNPLPCPWLWTTKTRPF